MTSSVEVISLFVDSPDSPSHLRICAEGFESEVTLSNSDAIELAESIEESQGVSFGAVVFANRNDAEQCAKLIRRLM